MGNSKAAGKALGKFLPNPKLKLREQLAEVCRYRHLSHRTENAYWCWIRDFLRFHRGKFQVSSDQVSSGAKLTKSPSPQPSPPPDGLREEVGAWRHPRELGAAEVRDYLSYLAVERKVAAATQRQALNGMTKLWVVGDRL